MSLWLYTESKTQTSALTWMVPITIKSNKIALIDFSGLNYEYSQERSRAIDDKHDSHTLLAAIGGEMWIWVPEKSNEIKYDKKTSALSKK